ncbi:hypothetical protein [Bradyrhizobium erythrophlei]|uniref:Nucleoside 2-deoxyribosyltransferase n=1 Tax=Bradyrhizobium erythrophlei TaxID=1437360 RepID=A0A1M5NMC3_9BRAD|nr:hypothetical protein [Bradyrhizobium erythrophlei]SHG90690.1 hypothetical protein SAMN05443248_3051 [Bradyrhizobium erythrophlei]
MRPFTVYMAGPITGLTYDGAENWRAIAKTALFRSGIQGISPLRGQEYLRDIGKISGTGEGYQHLNVLSTPRGITSQNRFDATRCDLLLVNLLGATSVSIGTVMEITWADVKRIPIVVAMEPKGNPHEHMLINEVISYRVPTLEDAIRVVTVVADGIR